MLSSAANGNNDDSTMPGDYESWPGPAARNAGLGNPFSPRGPMIPPARTQFPRIPPVRPTTRPIGRTPFPPMPMIPRHTQPPMRHHRMAPRIHHIRSHRRRPRSLTPDIVIERRSHCRSREGGGRRIIRIPLDTRPTLGLRGPPRRVLELERVRCHRRRRSRSYCYEYEYEYDDPPAAPQPTVMVANPISVPCSPSVQSPLNVVTTNNTQAAALALMSNLTQEAIDNLPRQIVHLPPIHLPGSQADATTELDTVILPAEIINPIDGTLSIIQANPGANVGGGIANIQSNNILAPIQPKLSNIGTNIGIPIRPPISPAMATDPLVQRFQNLFQSLTIPKTQPTIQIPSAPAVRPIVPSMSQFEPTVTRPTISSANTSFPNIGSYRPTNVTPYPRATITPYNSVTSTPSIPVSNPMYRPANITPYPPVTSISSNPTISTTYHPTSTSNIGPYAPANITPYANTSIQSSRNPFPQSTFESEPISSANYINSGLNSTQSLTSMPKSILRNPMPTDSSDPVYTRLSTPNLLSSSDSLRKTTRFT